MICLGIIGEYVGRIYDEVKQRPLWVVQESLGIAMTEKSRKVKPGSTCGDGFEKHLYDD